MTVFKQVSWTFLRTMLLCQAYQLCYLQLYIVMLENYFSFNMNSTASNVCDSSMYTNIEIDKYLCVTLLMLCVFACRPWDWYLPAMLSTSSMKRKTHVCKIIFILYLLKVALVIFVYVLLLIHLPKQLILLNVNLILYLHCITFQICISDSVQISSTSQEREETLKKGKRWKKRTLTFSEWTRLDGFQMMYPIHL